MGGRSVLRIEGFKPSNRKTGGDNEREAHQHAAPAHDRRHDGAQLRREDAQRLYPARQDIYSLSRPRAGYGRAEDLRLFQLHQTQAGVRAPSINGSVAALRFFFTVTLDRPEMTRHLTFVREPRKIPVVLSLEEIARLLEAGPGPKYKAALSDAYGARLRVSEVVALKVSDIDSERMLLRIEQGKGRKDRFAMLSPRLL